MAFRLCVNPITSEFPCLRHLHQFSMDALEVDVLNSCFLSREFRVIAVRE